MSEVKAVGRRIRSGGRISVRGETLVGVLFLVGVLISATAFAQNSPGVGMLEQDGFAALKAGDGPKATQLFAEAIKLDPKNAIVRFGAGVAEFLQRHDVEAKAHLEQALLLDPAFPQARAQLAQQEAMLAQQSQA